ncbi:MAG: trypsin-like peptidase domain-containing protein [Opitutaceae bacterium]
MRCIGFSGQLLGLIGLGTVLSGQPVSVHLRSGAEISADLIDRNTDRVVVDLGYSVLSIPMAEVLDVSELMEDGTPAPVTGDELFHVGGENRLSSVAANVSRLGSAVVQVSTPTGLGSGFIINPEGYVVTNAHVIAGEYSITVTVYEQKGSSLEKKPFDNVRILAFEPAIDLALLKIESSGGFPFVPVSIGDSDELERGETVFAIGSPLGLERTVSQGIVSLRYRSLGGRLYTQTTAQINPGNSGGPLFNLRGEVVGVNNMKAMMVGVEGVSFAIPSATLKAFLRNRDAFAFDERNPNSGFRYLEPPRPDNGVDAR